MVQQAIPPREATTQGRPPALQRLIQRDKMPLLVLLLAALVGVLAGLVCGLFESGVHWLAQQGLKAGDEARAQFHPSFVLLGVPV